MKTIHTSYLTLVFGVCLFGFFTATAQNDQFILENVKTAAPIATVTIHQNVKIKQLLNTKIKLDKEGAFSDHYKIQLYYGNLNQANSILNTAKNAFPDWDASIKWETPNYKVWIGKYRNRLAADRALKEIHEEFPNAFIFKPGK